MRAIALLLVTFLLLPTACTDSMLTPSSTESTIISTTQTQRAWRPWPELNTYDDETSTIIVNTGERFVIIYDGGDSLSFSFMEETHDHVMISLLGEEETRATPWGDRTFWFLFEALKPGDTQIDIKQLSCHFATGQVPILWGQEVFSVSIN
jgi:hypothetical protein